MMEKKINLLAILLSILELWSHISTCAASVDTFQDEFGYPITTENSLPDMVYIHPNPAFVGDHVYFSCEFLYFTNIPRDSIKELQWLKNGESIFYYHADNSYQSPLPGYEDKIHEYDMTDYHNYMWMLVDPSDEAFYQCRFSTNESEVMYSNEVYLTIASSEPCGANLTDEAGNLTTPLYPNSYPANSRCVWNIIAPEQFYIKLTFVDFELDYSYPTCYGDYVQIWDGADDKGMYCEESPNTIYSTGNTMTVIFHSDNSWNFRGFLAEYKFQNQSTPYKETLPRIPDFFWMHISPNPAYVGDIVSFECYAASVDEQYVKELHWLKNGERIYSHYADRSHQGPLPGYEEKIRYHRMAFNLHKMYMLVDPSDEATFQCWLVTNDGDNLRSTETVLTLKIGEPYGANLTDHIGYFATPSYPRAYPLQTHYVWNIIAPEQFYIKLTFVDFEVDTSYPFNLHPTCYRDYVHIWDGNNDLGIFCQQSPNTIYSTRNTMRVIFHSDGLAGFGGFLVQYEFQSQAITYTETMPNTTDPLLNFMFIFPKPAHVGDHVHFMCYFNQAAGIYEDSLLELHWLKNGERIFSHYADHSHQGPLPGYEEKIRYDYMMWEFHQMIMLVDPSDEAVFQCSIVTNGNDTLHSNEELLTLQTSEPCGANLTDDVSNFTSPLYPNSYPRNTHCVWNIIAPEQFYINLTFVDFEVPVNYPICYHYVQIWDGDIDMGMYCGYSLFPVYGTPGTVYSFSNKLKVILHSDDQEGLRGFRAKYEFNRYQPIMTTPPSTPEPCGTNLTGPVGNFTTPLYPNTYPRNTHCVWNIIAPEQLYVKLTFVEFELESSSYFCYDYVQIWDGNKDVGIYCGYSSPGPFYSTSNTMKVIFHSDDWGNFRGFYATYEFESNTTTPYTETNTTGTSMEYFP